MSRLLNGEDVRGGAELLNFLLKRNKPDGVIPKPLLQEVVMSLADGKTQANHEWKDAHGNIITLTINTPFSGGTYRSLEMKNLVNGNQDKARWPLALAFCIIEDVNNLMHSTAEKRKWWLWETNGGNLVLVTHDHEESGQFRYWINPDD